ncbi:COP23 domain-containing protein [Coleofasciculus sp. FACHB-1120]|uniref:COP23 domain-containing protein n=1 Tax=Coleofasciculus sp. FACHB-1120 TaxID=2692783 RepID=UPI001688D9D6|nr:COP23 domain-containing protein [Coleofasciculus sp. FACHB-1120]MBD2740639.1 hypothetical protein [Coleofasciculus sp. FACHB-1120]
MKLKQSVYIFFASAVTAVSTATFSIPAIADTPSVRFECQMIQNAPTTVIITSQLQKQFIRWVDPYFSKKGFSPLVRCEQVSARLNTLFSQNDQVITHGKMNDLPVICTTNSVGKGCNNLIYTLKPSQDPKIVLEDIFAMTDRNFSGRPLKESSCATYIDIKAWVQTQGRGAYARQVCSTP